MAGQGVTVFLRALATFCITLALAGLAESAENSPTFGRVYNTKENSAITFSCRESGPGRIDCDFTQARVSTRSTPEELPFVIEKTLADFRKMTLSEREAARKSPRDSQI